MQSAPSLRLRLLAIAAFTIVVALVVVGLSLGAVFERQVLKRVDQELQVRWDELAAAFILDETGAPSISRELTDPRYHQPYSGAYWQVVEAGGTPLTSRSLWDATLDTSDRSHRYGNGASFEIVGPGDADVYVLSRPVTLSGRTFELDVGLDHAEVDALRAAFDRDTILILGPIAAVLILGAWLQIRQSLGPLRDLESELKAVHAGTQPRLAGRFPREVEPVVNDLNQLLERQETLVRKARDRAGALAHGLKTPLTILAGEVRRLERRGERDAADKIRGQIDLIGRHVDRELARTRTAGASAAAGAFTQAAPSVERLIRLMRHMPRGEALDWQNELPADLVLRVDPDDFGEVVGNLLDNARKWADSRVVVRSGRNGATATVSIVDDGPGFADDARDRGVSGGTATDGSTGLGLGIVEDILSEYGVTLRVERAARSCAVSFDLPCETAIAAPTATEPTRPATARVA